MVSNVTPIGEAPKDTYSQFDLQIVYTSGEEEKLSCTYFGTSAEHEDFLVFVDGPPDDDSYPVALVNSKHIRSLYILNISEVEK